MYIFGTMTKEQIWLKYFNPCGSEVMNGYVIQTCVSQDCNKLPCFAKSSYKMAGFLLEGGTIEAEKEEFERYLGSLTGKSVVTPKGETVVLGQDNIRELVDSVANRAVLIVDGVRQCITKTVPIYEGYMSTRSPEERAALESVQKVNQRLRSFKGSRDRAVSLALEMKGALQKALDMGLGNLDIIARQALIYGLADQIPGIDTTGTILIGDPERIRPI
ncbi:MAG: hypothetical protein UX19_C0002G0005 [Candidatus Woesebacteria bacterium GW2011_GWA1_45_8]|uniref:Uncharacterized protein n=1 Tax=Candidatus Woesebacteria bacterium GW2011_GWA1_45_8 TaxID=1618559 RepID=A0A0G1Q3L2_9BACT|nr:MAG: hypothetical protein UX19_C0002G0005 [Candidatus Woesebacteria bacterium GW2011_GWA1_45_8]